MLIDVWHAHDGPSAPVHACSVLHRRVVKGLLRGDGPRYVGAWHCLGCRGWLPLSVAQHGVVVLDWRVYRVPGQLAGYIHSIPDLDRALADILVLQRAECAPAHTPAHPPHPPTHNTIMVCRSAPDTPLALTHAAGMFWATNGCDNITYANITSGGWPGCSTASDGMSRAT